MASLYHVQVLLCCTLGSSLTKVTGLCQNQQGNQLLVLSKLQEHNTCIYIDYYTSISSKYGWQSEQSQARNRYHWIRVSLRVNYDQLIDKVNMRTMICAN